MCLCIIPELNCLIKRNLHDMILHDSPVILATDTSDYRLTIKEALHIKHQKAHTSLNVVL